MASPKTFGSTQDTHFTPERQQLFLDFVADAYSLSAAAAAVGVHRDTVYDHRRSDPIFAAAVDSAVKQRGDFWEQKLRSLADREKPDTLAVIIGLKMTGRFVEERRGQSVVNVSVQVGDRPLRAFTPDELRQMLTTIEAQPGDAPTPTPLVIEGTIVEEGMRSLVAGSPEEEGEDDDKASSPTDSENEMRQDGLAT